MPSTSNIQAHLQYSEYKQTQGVDSGITFEPLLDLVEAAQLLRIHPKTLRTKARRAAQSRLFKLVGCGVFEPRL
jgi:hypothetical protein